MKTFKYTLLAALTLTFSNTLKSQADYIFSASSGTFTEITGGTNANSIEADDALTSPISLGFTLNYGGVNYTHIKASSNGFIHLDTSNTNSRTGNDLDNVAEPIIAPLWDDLDGRASNSKATYITTGTTPNQVFTFEWIKWEWNYTSGNEVISFQVKIYEGSNKIEFIYRPESSSPTSPTASIGLSGTTTGAGTFLSLNGTGANPSASSTLETTSLSSAPDSGRTYVFTEPTCKSPNNFRDSLTTDRTNTILFDSDAGTGKMVLYEYGTTGFSRGSGISGTVTTNNKGGLIALTGLTGATSYDMYVKVICSSADTSKEGIFNFTTTFPNPQEINFTGFTGANLSTLHNGWGEASGKPAPQGTTSAWIQSNPSQTSSLGATTARINLYTNTAEEWLLSPKINIKSTDSVIFKAAKTDWNNANTGIMGADDSLKVMISIDGGSSWDLLGAITSSTSISNSLKEFKYSLSSYAGNAAIIGFLAQDGPIDNTEDFDMHVGEIFIGTPPTNDISVLDILEPVDGACGNDSMKFKVVIRNEGIRNQSNFQVAVKISGVINTTLTTTVNSLNASTTDTLTIGNINTRNGGAYTFWAYSSLTGDENLFNDTFKLAALSLSSIPPAPTLPSRVDICFDTDTTITPSNTSTGNRWYLSSLGDSIVSEDSVYHVKGLKARDTLYVETFSLYKDQMGKRDNTGSGGTYTTFTDGLVFNVTAQVSLDSVTVYPGSSGNVTVRLLDASNNVLQTTTAPVNGISTGEQIAVGFTINPGNGYKLDASGSSVSNLFRNSGGAVYPYTSTNSSVSITQTINNLAGYYYFFYNWILRSEGCTSNRAMMVLDTLTKPQINLGPDTTFCKTQVNYNINATGAQLNYLWQDNSTAASYTATKTGSFWCKVTDARGCFASDTVEINAYPDPIINFPNVTNQCTNSDTLRLRFATPKGGVYGGSGVSNNILDPTSGTIGQNVITYTYTDQYNCVTVDTAFYDLFQAPNVSYTGNLSICENDSSIELTGGMPLGGNYIGSGINNNVLNPAAVGAGNPSFRYTYTDNNGCADSANGSIVIHAAPNAQLSTLGYWCINGGLRNLVEGTPANGNYFGSNVNGAQFDPMTAGLGSHTIQYTFTNSDNCSDTVQNNIEVEDFPEFDIVGDTSGCGDDIPELEVSTAGLTYAWGNGSTNQKTQVTTAGIMTVTVTDPNTQAGCNLSKSVEVIYDAVCAGLTENDNSLLQIYPNPATDRIYLTWELGSISTITLYNSVAEKVYQNTHLSGLNAFSIDIKNLSKGAYVIEAKSNSSLLRKRIVVQ